MCLEPVTKRIYVSPHARFIETEFPGSSTATPNTNTPSIEPSPQPPAPPPATTHENDAFEEEPTGFDLEATPMEHDAADDVGTIAERLARRRRTTAAV
eukprot:2871659-Pleurochrysis_carterae.AAC.1